MKKAGAITILSTMIMGLMAWAGARIVNHETRLSKTETHTEHIIKTLDRIDANVQEIRQRE